MRRLTPIEQFEFAERYAIEGPLNPHPTLGSKFTGLTAGKLLGDKLIVGFQLALNDEYDEYVVLAYPSPNLDQKSIKDWFERVKQPKLYNLLYRIYGDIGLMSQTYSQTNPDVLSEKQLIELLEELSDDITTRV